MAAGEAPPFWWEKADWRAAMLWPVSALYGAAATVRMARARRAKMPVPVLCVGNFTVGGEGKTPIAIALARQARRQGLKPGFLSRGHGGSLNHAHMVDPDGDSVRLVGDEPLLLARHAPTAVTPDRAAGARLLARAGCDLVIMDDGFQSARIHIDYALMVVDGHRGLGNGRTIPAGPLRAPLVAQLSRADAIVRMGGGEAADGVVRMAARAGRPIFDARLKPKGVRALKGKHFLAFAGIGNPAKFFETLEAAGARVAQARPFADHHAYTDEDLRDLAALADEKTLALITTTKDMARLTHGTSATRAFAQRVGVLEVEAVFEPAGAAQTILRDTLAAWHKRAASGHA